MAKLLLPNSHEGQLPVCFKGGGALACEYLKCCNVFILTSTLLGRATSDFELLRGFLERDYFIFISN